MRQGNQSVAWLLFTLTLVLLALGLVAFCQAQGSQPQTASADGKDAGSKASAPEQPLPFSHKAHIAQKLTCDTCHENPDPGNQVTLPGAATCMACHQAIAKEKPAIRRLAQFDQDHKPVPWVRVYMVPAFVYWSHRTHLEAGMKCEMCHGQVDQMDIMTKATNVTTMGGCVECHRQKKASTGCKLCHESQSSQLRLLRAPQS
jgi:Cytochrome c7 and related cytochrome c/Class III cytochrome C family